MLPGKGVGCHGGGLNLFAEEDPRLDAASDRLVQFVLTECGYDLDAND